MSDHTPREAAIIRAIRRRAKDYGRALVVRKLHGSAFAVEGDPDTYGCWRGRAFAIEVKRPGETPGPLQLERLREWAEAGAITSVVFSADEFFDVLLKHSELP